MRALVLEQGFPEASRVTAGVSRPGMPRPDGLVSRPRLVCLPGRHRALRRQMSPVRPPLAHIRRFNAERDCGREAVEADGPTGDETND